MGTTGSIVSVYGRVEALPNVTVKSRRRRCCAPMRVGKPLGNLRPSCRQADRGPKGSGLQGQHHRIDLAVTPDHEIGVGPALSCTSRRIRRCRRIWTGASHEDREVRAHPAPPPPREQPFRDHKRCGRRLALTHAAVLLGGSVA